LPKGRKSKNERRHGEEGSWTENKKNTLWKQYGAADKKKSRKKSGRKKNQTKRTGSLAATGRRRTDARPAKQHWDQARATSRPWGGGKRAAYLKNTAIEKGKEKEGELKEGSLTWGKTRKKEKILPVQLRNVLEIGCTGGRKGGTGSPGSEKKKPYRIPQGRKDRQD